MSNFLETIAPRTYRVYGGESHNTVPFFEGGQVYVMRFNQMTGNIFKQIDPFELLPKYYGIDRIQARTKLVINSFKDTNKSMGVLFSGLKGTGKTQLAVKIAVESKLPILLIDKSLFSMDFDRFVEMLMAAPEPVCVFLDEFEKLYTKHDQQRLLTLMSGAATKKHLFLLCANDSSKISEYMLDRPERIRYTFDYYGLKAEEIMEVIADMCPNPDQLSDFPKMVSILTSQQQMTYDVIIKFIKDYILHSWYGADNLVTDFNFSFRGLTSNVKVKFICDNKVHVIGDYKQGNVLGTPNLEIHGVEKRGKITKPNMKIGKFELISTIKGNTIDVKSDPVTITINNTPYRGVWKACFTRAELVDYQAVDLINMNKSTKK